MPFLVRSTITFTRPQTTYAHEYAILDVDGDGDQDIILAQSRYPLENVGNPLIVLLNNGVGGFTDGTSTIFPSGAPLTVHPRWLALADYNRDGRMDVFIADHGLDGSPWPGAQNTLLLSSGSTGFINATDRLPSVLDFTHSTTSADVDGDGDIDILAMNVFGGTPQNGPTTGPYILINDGTGHFVRHDDRLPANVAARDHGYTYLSSLFFDADGDGDQDLFLGSFGGVAAFNFSRILYNDGTGDFSNALSVDLSSGPFAPLTAGAVSVTSADLNGDGRIDLIVDLQGAPTLQGHYIQLLINRGSAGFVDETQQLLPQPQVLTGPWVHSVMAVDFNGDGYVDLIARNGQYPPIFLNDGTGHFINLPGGFLDYSGWATPEGINLATIDANGDGRMDLIADLGIGNNTIYLFAQQDPGPSQTGTANADAMIGDASDETLLGMAGDDVIFGGAGNDLLSGGAGADKMVGGAGSDLFTDTAANLNGDTIADFTRGDRIVITDANAGSTLGWNGSVLSYGSTSLTLTTLQNASITTGSAPGGGVQIAYGGPPLIVSGGANVTAAASEVIEPSKIAAIGAHFPLWLPESAQSSVEPHQVRLTDEIFALA